MSITKGPKRNMLVEDNILSFIILEIDIFTFPIILLKSSALVEKMNKLDLKVQKTSIKTGPQLEWKNMLAKKSNAFAINVVIFRQSGGKRFILF